MSLALKILILGIVAVVVGIISSSVAWGLINPPIGEWMFTGGLVLVGLGFLAIVSSLVLGLRWLILRLLTPKTAGVKTRPR
jgi:hypothetical protein